MDIRFFLGKKGDLASPVIMWIAVFAVSLIVFSWYATTIRPLHGESNVIEYDLRQLSQYASNACNSRTYEAKYNPRMNYGEIMINNTEACINTTEIRSCIQLPCNIGQNFTARLEDIVDIYIVKTSEYEGIWFGSNRDGLPDEPESQTTSGQEDSNGVPEGQQAQNMPGDFGSGVGGDSFPSGIIPTFPGAEGFGSLTPGGRGGRVIYVSNLEDSGPGSLRAALEAEGPRIVVFNVSGTIELRDQIVIRNPYITVAGQSAPGGGITISTHPSNRRTPITIHTHDVVIRFLRIRPGPCSTSGCGDNLDAMQILSGHNIILDHNSFSWSVDEVLSTWYSPTNITIQWNIISEALDRSVHSKGGHSAGFLIGSRNVNISAHHNLLAHNVYRNGPYTNLREGYIDYVNNVLYNGIQYAEISTQEGFDVKVNFVGNYQKPGPDSLESGVRPALRLALYTDNTASIYLRGNIGYHRPSDDLPESDIARMRYYSSIDYPDTLTRSVHAHLSSTRHPAPLVTTTSAFQAYEDVLRKAGAVLPIRDAIDERIIRDVREGTGRIIDHPDDVGGWVEMEPGIPSIDSDGDGMPDWWEIYYFGCATCAVHYEDANGNGYTNIEDYLNWLAAQI